MSVATVERLSFAPGTTPRRPIAADYAYAPSASMAPVVRTLRALSSAPAAASSGPPMTGHISGGVVSVRSSRAGKRSPTKALGAGLKSSEVWAASWWATTTAVRCASASPATATTFHVGRDGSIKRRNHWRPPVMSSAIAAAANRSEEHTSELQSPYDLVCRLLL